MLPVSPPSSPSVSGLNPHPPPPPFSQRKFKLKQPQKFLIILTSSAVNCIGHWVLNENRVFYTLFRPQAAQRFSLYTVPLTQKTNLCICNHVLDHSITGALTVQRANPASACLLLFSYIQLGKNILIRPPA